MTTTRPLVLCAALCASILLAPRAAHAQISREETIVGGTAKTSPVLLSAIQGGTDQTYVLIIVTNDNRNVDAVSGAGLVWTEQIEQCSRAGAHGIRLWTAQGSPSTSFQVQIDYDGSLPLTAILSRYTGARSIVAPTGANLIGQNDVSCVAGQSDFATLTLSSITNGDIHVMGVAPGNRTVDTFPPAYTLIGNDAYGNGGTITHAYAFDQQFAAPATSTLSAELSGQYWWTTAGVVLSTAEPIAPIFVDVSTSVGFDLQSTVTENLSSSLHFADFDNDGDLDTVVTGNNASRYFSNVNEGESFTSTLFGGGNESGAASLIDIDNDDDIDVWISTEKLYENDGLASFTDQGDLGLWSPSLTSATAAADLNHDGYADLTMFSASGNWIGHHEGQVDPTLAQTDDPSYGMNDSGSVGNGAFAATGDVNNDGHLDYYYHYNGGKLFLSQADGTFIQNASGIAVTTAPNKPVGPAFADYDNDADLDLFIPSYEDGSPGTLWRNDNGYFANAALAAGITNTDPQRSSAFGDYDNDGDLDLYITINDAPNIMYQNQGDGTFVATSVGAEIGGETQDARFVDYDNDGDLDLAMTQQADTNVILQNTTNTDTYLKVRVLGHGSAMTNKAAIGIRVELFEADGTTFLARREIGTATGFGGTEPLWLHFGGLDPQATYVLKAHMARAILTASVVPSEVSTTIGTTTIAQMYTFEESSPKLATWREIDPR